MLPLAGLVQADLCRDEDIRTSCVWAKGPQLSPFTTLTYVI